MTPSELKAARARLGLSQSALAARLGVDVMTVSRWERGERQPPPFLHLSLAQLERERTPAQ